MTTQGQIGAELPVLGDACVVPVVFAVVCVVPVVLVLVVPVVFVVVPVVFVVVPVAFVVVVPVVFVVVPVVFVVVPVVFVVVPVVFVVVPVVSAGFVDGFVGSVGVVASLLSAYANAYVENLSVVNVKVSVAASYFAPIFVATPS